jgi:D-alanyl-D-alanine carboxypeptidase (penicillin-binding protein 5/6)
VQSYQFLSSPIKYFLKEMNNNATKLKMTHTHYDSPHGLNNKQNYSCALDYCKLAVKCMEIPEIRTVVNTPCYKYKGSKGSYKWYATNKLLGKN